jgi:hypothetical protein
VTETHEDAGDFKQWVKRRSRLRTRRADLFCGELTLDIGVRRLCFVSFGRNRLGIS